MSERFDPLQSRSRQPPAFLEACQTRRRIGHRLGHGIPGNFQESQLFLRRFDLIFERLPLLLQRGSLLAPLLNTAGGLLAFRAGAFELETVSPHALLSARQFGFHLLERVAEAERLLLGFAPVLFESGEKFAELMEL